MLALSSQSARPWWAMLAVTATATLAGCKGTSEELFAPVTDAGVLCEAPDAGQALAEWHANGNTLNDISCPGWSASTVGQVSYGPGREGQAWKFRSTQTSQVGDPNYIVVPGSAAFVYPQVTVDVWVNQTHFNAYAGSNRVIVSTGFKGFNFNPGEWMLYVHEDTSVNFLFRVRPASGAGDDFATCSGSGPNSPSRTPIGVWVRYTATYDGNTVRCYKDGALVGMHALPDGMRMPADALVIGRNYPGDVDAVRIFDRALGDAEIARAWP